MTLDEAQQAQNEIDAILNEYITLGGQRVDSLDKAKRLCDLVIRYQEQPVSTVAVAAIRNIIERRINSEKKLVDDIMRGPWL